MVENHAGRQSHQEQAGLAPANFYEQIEVEQGRNAGAENQAALVATGLFRGQGGRVRHVNSWLSASFFLS